MAKAMVDQPLKAAGRWPAQGQWTYEHTRLPSDGLRYEVLRGELYRNAAPRPRHQETLLNLVLMLASHVRAHDLGQVYTSPIDVILGVLATPVQPDVLFIAKSRLVIVGDRTIQGAPDFIAEVLSPSNADEDRGIKRDVYTEGGVSEYWLVDSDARTIESFVLEDGASRRAARAGIGELIASAVIPGFTAAVDAVCRP